MKRILITAALLALIIAALSAWMHSLEPPTRQRPPDSGTLTDQVDDGTEVGRLVTVVTGADGQPISNATVEVAGTSGETDDRGRFATTVGPGDYEVVVSKEDYVNAGPLAARAEIHVAADSELEVPITLRQPGTIIGSVTAAGKPIEARLSLIYAADEFAVDGAGRSSSDGTFTLEDVAPGRLRILVETPGEYANTESREIRLLDGDVEDGIEIDLAAGGSIAGKVTASDGEPIGGAEVLGMGESSARSRRAETTATGGFRLDQFPAGVARLRVRAPGYSEKVIESVAVQAGEVSVVEISLEEGTGVWGRVATPTGEPPEVAFVMLLGSDDENSVVQAAADGTYRLEIEPASGDRVMAVSPHFSPSGKLDARSGARVDLELSAGGTIRGRVVDSRGTPVTDFEVGVESLRIDGPMPYRSRAVGNEQYVSSDGTFEFGPVRPGEYWLRAAAPDHAPGSAGPFTVRAGSTVDDVVIRLTSGGTVRGRVTDESGEPVGNAAVTVFDPLSPFRSAATRTSDDGTYELAGVPPGRRSLRVAARSYLTAVSSGLAIPAGGEAERDVVLGRKKKGERFSFHGIGAVLAANDGAVEVRETMEEKPASLFGLQSGDRIRAVDGQSTRDMRLGNVVELIRGEEGVPVELEIEREGQGTLTVEVERGRVVVK